MISKPTVSGAATRLGAVPSYRSNLSNSNCRRGAVSSCSGNRSTSHCRKILSRSNSLEVGVLGGSISWGAELENKFEERYSALLQTRLRPQVAARVHNLAMPATGSGYASFCIDQIMPRDVQVLIIDFNFNDAYGNDVFGADRDSTAQSPSLSFERLIRNALSRPSPPWLIIVLGVCQRWLKCEQIHRAVTLHYAAQGVMSVSLNRDGVRLPTSLHHNGSHHPTRAGHAEIARLIERAIMERSRCCHTWPRLPPPLLPMPPWEIAHARWNCKACDYTSCSHLQPIAAAGFELTHAKGLSDGFMGKVLLPRSTSRSAPFSLEPGLSPYRIQSRVRCGRLVGPRLRAIQPWPSK